MKEKIVLVNQIGYLIEQKKYVLIKEANVGEMFSVVHIKSNEKVYEGKIFDKKYSNTAGESVGWGEFSAVKDEGIYKIVAANGEESYEFAIGNDIYGGLFKDAVRFFYLQRCGEEIPESYGGKWAHPVCHDTLARVYGTDQFIDVSGGWHDAGDYGRYTVATAKVIADILLAYEENPTAFEKDFNVPRRERKLPYILEEVKGQLIWLFKMQDLVSGGVYHKVTCAGFPAHDVMPEKETEELIVCPISTDATGSFAAVMAMGYEIYSKWDNNLAQKCLEAAKKAWNYLDDQPISRFKNPEGITTGEYGGRGDLDSRYWAAAQLFKVTGEDVYKEKAEYYAMLDTSEEINNQLKDGMIKPMYYGYGWTGKGAYGDHAYLRSKGKSSKVEKHIIERIKNKADEVMNTASQDGYKIQTQNKRFTWGSNMDFLNLGLFVTDAYVYEKKEEYLEQATVYIDYCCGMNPLGICYITGYGSYYPEHPHHRPAMATKATIPGMLVGGACWGQYDDIAKEYLMGQPGAKCYIDHEESYSTNEVDIYWNSTLVWVLARMNRV